MPKGVYQRPIGYVSSNPFKKGHKDLVHKEIRERNGKIYRGEKSTSWKVCEATYSSIHDWVRYWKGNPDQCEKCGTNEKRKYKYHWANIDHKYRRVLDDYIPMCVSCHKIYDLAMAKK